ncbi:HAMP domain-containing protein, partial [bacterium]
MNTAKTLDPEHKRRRREFFIILLVVPAIIFLTYVESHISILSGNIPVPTNILFLGLININIILLVLLIFLVLRNTVKLFFERKRRVMGSRLMTKLISAFVGLTIVPTFILFFVVIGFINKSIDGWFAIKIEDSLKESLELGRSYYNDLNDRVSSGARGIAVSAAKSRIDEDSDQIMEIINARMLGNDFSSIEVFTPEGRRAGYAISGAVNKNMVPDIEMEHVAKALTGEASSFVDTLSEGDVVRAVSPVMSLSQPPKVVGVVAVSYYVSKSLINRMKDISTAFESYKQLKLLKYPVKVSYFTILLIITLLIVFFAIWIGRYLAKEITGPIQQLAEGTHAVASGNLEYKIKVASNDEIGVLVRSFNRMTEDLKAGKSMLEEANVDLRSSNSELDRRRRFVEIILSNVPSGVISIDRLGRITSLNRVAAELLGAEEGAAIGKNYKEALREEDMELFRDMIRDMNELGVE